ncbi:hypothetical protein [Paracoccus sp. AK26]|uniref:hypothetical protein n=1 Tax=Paracoccus sp. AK26 TaxID=2589076 RepID=UPI00142857EC|nr:hypothetical protein [Paracoccus sp. AK26]QIR85025.1 hypothetical protein FIU66_07280 [Paracoccus sp. AK26]
MVAIEEQKPLPTVRIEEGFAVIRVPLSEVHGLRVCLADCPCRATKSTATQDIRRRLSKALGLLQQKARL